MCVCACACACACVCACACACACVCDLLINVMLAKRSSVCYDDCMITVQRTSAHQSKDADSRPTVTKPPQHYGNHIIIVCVLIIFKQTIGQNHLSKCKQPRNDGHWMLLMGDEI